jgi:uncharacterized damage-inducible protein DinB
MSTEQKTNERLSTAREYVRYNQWATHSLVKWHRTKPEEWMHKKVPSNFSSIKRTLAHIWQVNKYWLNNLRKQDTKSPFGSEFNGSLQEVYQGPGNVSDERAAFTAVQTDDGIMDACPFTLSSGSKSCARVFEVILHVVTNGSYNRGQVVTISRILGLNNPPDTDYMFFVLKINTR